MSPQIRHDALFLLTLCALYVSVVKFFPLLPALPPFSPKKISFAGFNTQTYKTRLALPAPLIP
jgi:hypothetical protein